MTASNPRWIVEDKNRLLVAVRVGRQWPYFARGQPERLESGDIARSIRFGDEPPITDVLFKRLGYRVPMRIMHIQIEKGGILEFGAYDNFHYDAMFWGPALTGHFIESSLAQGILSPESRGSK